MIQKQILNNCFFLLFQRCVQHTIVYKKYILNYLLQICCDELQTVMVPLPDCASGEWGPTKATRLFGLIPITHQVYAQPDLNDSNVF